MHFKHCIALLPTPSLHVPRGHLVLVSIISEIIYSV